MKGNRGMTSRDDFTIEKLEINKRLGLVEVAISQVLSAVADLKTNKNEIHDHIEKEMREFRAILYGEVGNEDKPGLIVSIALLKNEAKTRDNIIKMITSAIIALAVAYVWNRVVKGP